MIALTTMRTKSKTIERLVLFCVIAFVPSLLRAQTTLVSGTIVDAGGQSWKNGTYQFTFEPSDVNPTAQYTQGGAPFNRFQTVPSSGPGSLDNTGSFASVAVPDNLTIFPSGSTWELQVCPAATASNGCFNVDLTITGASQNLTSSVIPPPIVVNLTNPQPAGASAYNDGEIIGARIGSTYYNLTDGTVHVCQVPLCTWTSTTASSILPTDNTFANNNRFKGPDPLTDATTFGVRALVNAPFQTLTATTGTNSPSVATTGIADFIVNDGIVIPGAGAATSQSTPSAPTVTPIGATGTNTDNYKCVGVDSGYGLTTASATGSTSVAPQVFGQAANAISTISRSANVVTVVTSSSMPFSSGTFHAVIANVTGGTTQFSGLQLVTMTNATTLTYPQTGANESGTVGSGSYVLFKNAFIITTAQATAGSNQVVLTTDVNHNIGNFSRPVKIFVDGIQFSAASPQAYADGTFGVAAVTANTITINTSYTSPITTSGTASTAYTTSTYAAQMTATVYPVIDVACPALSGTTQFYAVYGDYGTGTFALVNFTPWGTNILEDYGPAFTQAGVLSPPAMNLPATPPGAAQNQVYVGQITGINGSTLTVSPNVPTAVTSVTSHHDNSVALLNTLKAACSDGSNNGISTSGYGTAYIPRIPPAGGGVNYILISAPLDISASCNRSPIVDGAPMWLNGTIFASVAGLFDWERPSDLSGRGNITNGGNSGFQVQITGNAPTLMVSSPNAMKMVGMNVDTNFNGQVGLEINNASNTDIENSSFYGNSNNNLSAIPLYYYNAQFGAQLHNITSSCNVNVMTPISQSGNPPLGDIAYWPVPCIEITGAFQPKLKMDGINYPFSRGIQFDNLYANTHTLPYAEIDDVDTFQAPQQSLLTINGNDTLEYIKMIRDVGDSIRNPLVACVRADSNACAVNFYGEKNTSTGAGASNLSGTAFRNAFEILVNGFSPLQNTNECSLASSSGNSCSSTFTFGTMNTSSNCSVNSVSPAACGSAAAGAFVVPTTTTTYTVNTTAVTSHSRILLMPLSFASDLPSSPTCVAPAITSEPTVSAVSAGVSFTISEASTTGQTCWEYLIVN